MEKGDIDLHQLNSLISWKLLRPVKFMKGKCALHRLLSKESTILDLKKRPRDEYGIYVAFVLLLMWPATISAPLLTSAVDWLPHYRLLSAQPINESASNSNSTTRYLNWQEYLQSDIFREYFYGPITLEYARFLLASNALGTHILNQGRCRHINKLTTYPANMPIHDAIYPCIEIGDIIWSKDEVDTKPMVDRLRRGVDVSTGQLEAERNGSDRELGQDFNKFQPGSIQLLDLKSTGNFLGSDYPNLSKYSKYSIQRDTYSDLFKYDKDYFDCISRCPLNRTEEIPLDHYDCSDKEGNNQCASKRRTKYPGSWLYNATLYVALMSSRLCAKNKEWYPIKQYLGDKIPDAI
jgi:hypothetical protein